ncbi:MAG: hypothetical protein BWY11_01398 [Firmicutes bacterium ADurb.Bin182]|nr:MAG: hypothetical protein BWY11_01398 [Firmicutes bacterium ADurb.Bin182]
MGNIFHDNNSLLLIVLLLCLCGDGFKGDSCGRGCGNDCLLPILLLCLCGGGFGGFDHKCC